jgi:hypothetical protein
VCAIVFAIAGTMSIAQTSNVPAPKAPAAPASGELWSVTTVQQFVGRKDLQPPRPENQQFAVCYPRGSVSISQVANAELPEELKKKCWLADQRTEPRRQQTKYACNDGTSAEVATRQETDGSFGSQYVVNFPDKGGVSVTRTMRRIPGVCEVSSKPPVVPALPSPPAQSSPTGAPAASDPAK